jgi:peptidoglycan-N-acetylglucosamine deacetylase
VVRDIVAAGHEVAHHGYLHEQPTGASAQQEADHLDRGLAALEEVAGVRSVGYRAPMWDLSWRSPALRWALDDWEQYCYLPDISGTGLIETPRKARELWQGEFEGLRSVGGCWVLTNHPFLTGRPARAQQLDELMAHVVSCTDVWTASLEEIAVHVRSLRLEPRSVEYPADLP